LRVNSFLEIFRYSDFANATVIHYGIRNYKNKNRLHGKVKEEWGLKFQAIHLHKKSDRPDQRD
jgi:hypothetical protein